MLVNLKSRFIHSSHICLTKQQKWAGLVVGGLQQYFRRKIAQMIGLRMKLSKRCRIVVTKEEKTVFFFFSWMRCSMCWKKLWCLYTEYCLNKVFYISMNKVFTYICPHEETCRSRRIFFTDKMKPSFIFQCTFSIFSGTQIIFII